MDRRLAHARSLPAFLANFVVLAAPLAAQASDCDKILAAVTAQAKVPYASAIDTTKPDKTVVHSEAISMGGKLYVQVQGNWRSMPFNPQDMIDRIMKMRDQAKLTCAKTGTEPVAGESASVFSGHGEYNGHVSDDRFWISDRSGLPLKSEIRIGNGSTIVQTYRYDHVEPPPNAQEMGG